jgi:hypothetical protein
MPMRFDRPLGRPQLVSYLFVDLAPDDKLEYLPFARG